ncbi:DUF2914 domain-containing protein [Allohahella sp. A8]|uniref:DUF2914 domain-containing protein n=1 Tax=Allohahella sp. A8 TaxID=3141461 RepID=UPI003A810ADB
MSQKNGFSAQREDRISSPVTVTVYYWHRIVLFGLLVVFIIGGLAYWGFTQFSATPKPVIPGSSAELAIEQPEETDGGTDTLSEYEQAAVTPTPADAPVFDSQVEPSEPESAAEAAAPALAETAAPVADTSDSEEAAASVPQDRQTFAEVEVSAESALLDDAAVLDEAADTDTVYDTSPIAGEDDTVDAVVAETDTGERGHAPKATPTEGFDSARGKPTRTEILSDAIARASLAAGLRDREPIGIYENAVSLNGKDLITVYMFTQTIGYVGETLFHNWYLNDKRIAQVTIKPWISPMRASSSKKIIPPMIGYWRVEIVDANDKKLAVTTFEVVE